MNTEPKEFTCRISVIVAVRNAEATLQRTLQSLKQQTVQDFEIILIDGASTDGTLRIVKEYSDIIRVQVSELDSGISDAWNKGIRLAKGEWITFLNAGDLLHRDHFKRALPALGDSSRQHTILYCDVLKFNEKNAPTIKIVGRQPTSRGIGRGGIGFPHPGSLSSSTCFNEIGNFDTSLKIAIDTDWLLRCFKAGYCFKKFQSCAYMAEGGVSDRKFGAAMREYFTCTIRLGLTSRRAGSLFSVLLPLLRHFLHIFRTVANTPLRTLKHVLISVANGIAQAIPFFWLRRTYFTALGFKLGSGASIAMGLRFYRLGQITIGENSVINRQCLLDNRNNITIGNNVSIARGVSIFTAGHDINSPFFEMTSESVTIEDHVVIFSGATIMPGVKIGRGAVIYGCAVVTKDVDAMTLVGGVPAAPIGIRNVEPIYALNYPFPLAM